MNGTDECAGPLDGWEDVRCSIVVASHELTASHVTALVGVEPTRARLQGEPISPRRPETLVASHLWVWQPGDSVERSLDAQLDAIWLALLPCADAFRTLGDEAEVRLAIWINHHGTNLRLGWALSERHVEHAAAFGASLDIDEYDCTET